MLELNQVYKMDCLEGMKLIPNDSINLICIDPPYNIGKDKRWDKWNTVDAYIEFMTEVFKECERVLKPNGSFYWFHNDMNQIRKLMDSLDNTSFIFKQLITWNKIDPSFKNYGYVQQRLSIDGMRNYYNGFTEYCLFYTFQKEDWLNEVLHSTKGYFMSIKEYLRNERKRGNFTREDVKKICGFENSKGASMVGHYFDDSQWQLPKEEHYLKMQETGYWQKPFSELQDEYKEKRKVYEEQRYPFNVATVKADLRANSNVWLYPPAKKQGHVTPKPVEMIENIIKHSSNKGDTVLDCFMGSGTTALASVNTGRFFIGFEREQEYIDITNKRLEELKLSQ